MAGKWRKVVDPITGKSRFTNEPDPTETKTAPVPVNKNDEKDPDKLYCCDCDKEITGRLVTAVGKKWHTECFACHACHKQFEMNNLKYTIDAGVPYCQKCITTLDEQQERNRVHEFKSASSDLVSEPEVISTYVAMGPQKQYGAAAAAAAGAGGSKPTSLASLLTGSADDATQEDSPDDQCVVCDKKIVGVGVGTSEGMFHEQCFKCGLCHEVIVQSSSHSFHNHVPHHSECYKKVTSPPCGYCGKAAYGKCYKVGETKYHPDCYVCAQCAKSLTGGHLQGPDQKLYCSGACKTKGPAAAGASAAAT